MNSEQMERMARWLAKLEPEFFMLLELNKSYLKWALKTKKEVTPDATYWHKFVIDLNNEFGLDIDQLGVYDACSRAAVTRGWDVRVKNSEVSLPLYDFSPACIGAIKFDGEYHISDTYPIHQDGFALADALIQAHGITDWQTREPEVKS